MDVISNCCTRIRKNTLLYCGLYFSVFYWFLWNFLLEGRLIYHSQNDLVWFVFNDITIIIVFIIFIRVFINIIITIIAILIIVSQCASSILIFPTIHKLFRLFLCSHFIIPLQCITNISKKQFIQETHGPTYRTPKRKRNIVNLLLIHFSPMFYFYTPWKRHKSTGYRNGALT